MPPFAELISGPNIESNTDDIPGSKMHHEYDCTFGNLMQLVRAREIFSSCVTLLGLRRGSVRIKWAPVEGNQRALGEVTLGMQVGEQT